jgi:hypothetical protein
MTDELQAVRDRDAESGATWFTGPASFTAQAARDRRYLLAQYDETVREYSAIKMELWRERDEARADAAAVRELMNVHNLGGWTDALGPMKRAIAAEAHVALQGRAIEAVKALIEESRGVAGLHLNGDEAPWEDLRTGGRHQEWLLDFDAALSELAHCEVAARGLDLRCPPGECPTPDECRALEDAVTTGTGILLDGKRVDPATVRLGPNEATPATYEEHLLGCQHDRAWLALNRVLKMGVPTLMGLVTEALRRLETIPAQYSLPAGAWVEHGGGWVKVHALSSPEAVAALCDFLARGGLKS